MLRRLRIGISALLFVLISFFFLDFAEILPNSFHRLAHLQFIPAILSLSIGNAFIRACILFYNLPYGYLAGCDCANFQSNGKKEKKI